MTKPIKWHVRPAKTQISLGIRPVWSESLLSAWRKRGSLATHWAQSEDSDQTGRMPRLIWVFAGRTVFCWFCHEVAHFLTWKDFRSYVGIQKLPELYLDQFILTLPWTQKLSDETSNWFYSYFVASKSSECHFHASYNCSSAISIKTSEKCLIVCTWNSLCQTWQKLSNWFLRIIVSDVFYSYM